jgi:N-acetylglucosamine-6-phosphate deacetylase
MRFTGCELADAVLAASDVPARCLGLPDRGRIELGRRADLVGLDGDGNVVLTLVAGMVAYDKR